MTIRQNFEVESVQLDS